MADLGGLFGGDGLGGFSVGEDLEAIAGTGHAGQTEAFDRRGGAGRLDLSAVVVDEGAHLAGVLAAEYDIAHAECAAFDEHSGGGAHAGFELGFNDIAFGAAGGIGLEFEDIGLQEDHFEQVIDAVAGLGADGTADQIAAPLFGGESLGLQLLHHALHIRGGHIDLIDGNHHGNAGGLDMLNGLAGLRHDAVVGGDDDDGDVGEVGAAGTHGGEGRVAGGIEEGNLLAAQLDGVGTDVLGDAAGFTVGDLGIADLVEQGGLAVVDMAEEGDHGRTGHQVFGLILIFGAFFEFALDAGATATFLNLNGEAVFFCDLADDLHINALIDGGQNIHLHQLGDDDIGLKAEHFGEVLDDDGATQAQHVAIDDLGQRQ